jgi:hypothetical protein
MPTLYVGVVMIYWHFVFYHLQLTQLCANAVYVFSYILFLPEDGYE